MMSDAEGLLRGKLKEALQHAKKLYDDGLLDEKEFKDLKAHELAKYKEQLAALTASTAPQASESAAGSPTPGKATDAGTPMGTPDNNRSEVARKPAVPIPVYTTPPVLRRRRGKEELLFVDSNTYRRLTTPPIFRRRSAKKRKIVVPSTELQALQRLHDENARSI